MRALMWFREDLRIADNTALYHAAKFATDGVIGIFLMTPNIWQKHDMASCRVDFLYNNVNILAEELANLNIPLLTIKANSDRDIPKLLLKIATQYQTQGLFFNKQYELDESRRDQEVKQLFTKNKYSVFTYDDQVIFAPGKILSKEYKYYKIFTPFKKAWLNYLQTQEQPTVLPKPKKQKPFEINCAFQIINAPTNSLWPAGEKYAHTQLKKFIQYKITHYHQQRDIPAINGTSQLSPYLSAGIISARQCLYAALEADKHPFTQPGITTWINELIWREFYKHLTHAIPRISMNKPLKLETDKLNWNHDEEKLHAWQQGQTGYPIIDAAMRQLNTTGWMHNRLRMLTAMFLSKILFIDWRLGERYFMQHLIDGDFAANNGGWQWCASTGTDAVPYFRVFNPTLQSKKFDPDGIFIKHYCPELISLAKNTIHAPYQHTEKLATKLAYPKPIVNFAMARQTIIAAFKALSK